MMATKKFSFAHCLKNDQHFRQYKEAINYNGSFYIHMVRGVARILKPFFCKIFSDERGSSSKIFESIDQNRANLMLFPTFFFFIQIGQFGSYFVIKNINPNRANDAILKF